ncbi:shikimate transporter [Sesbania bispinosa]|nr:shikimate transporter [Sesbania bispinosa]
MDSEWESGESEMETLQIPGGGNSSLPEDSDAGSSDSEEQGVETAVNKAERVGFGSVVKKRRDEDDYDFVSFPWVESLVARTRSIYADEKTISAFVDCRDVVDGNFPGNVECTWMMEDDRVCSRVPSAECRPFVLV